MSLTYRTRRRLQRLGAVVLFLTMVITVGWFCWVVWLERYIVYTRDGAVIDFERSEQTLQGEVAVPPVAGNGPGIHFNEGENAISTSTEMTQLFGYYITADMLLNDMEGTRQKVEMLDRGTPVMIELKGGWGSFYYSSDIDGAIRSASMDVAAVDELIEYMQSRNMYLIAQIPAFRDYTYALNHVNAGIPFTGGGGALWMDDGGCYWLKPTDSGIIGYLASIILELRGMGFHEVVLRDFEVPNGERVIYNGDEQTDLLSAANTLITACSTSYFTVSFTVDSTAFPLPDGRCRIYVNNVSAKDVERSAQQVTFSDPDLRLVFMADTTDSRYDSYSVVRTLDLIDLPEAKG